jgi:hypothetical protein
MALDPPGWIRPGQSAQFVYVGEMIPNQIDVKNLDDGETASYITEGGGSWRLYGEIPRMQTATIYVEWFGGIGRFYNISRGATIVVSGDGLRPYDPRKDKG